jgi:hypothetical protein
VFLAKFYFVEHIRFHCSRQGKSGISVLILQLHLPPQISASLHATPLVSGVGFQLMRAISEADLERQFKGADDTLEWSIDL